MLLAKKKSVAQDDNAMKKTILTYFETPKKSSSLEEDLSEFDPIPLRKMYYALIRTGLIVNITTRTTKGAVYRTSRLGLEVLKKL